jgi:hypothetical protein
MNILGRVARRIVFRAARGIYRRRGFIALGAVLVASALVASSFNLGLPDLFSAPQGDGGGSYSGSSESEPQATLSYIRGQQVYDARLVWDAYSERMRRAYQQRGAGIDDVQRQLEASKQRGPKIEQAQYIGSYPIPSGKMAFYVIAQSSGGRGSVSYVPYTFTLDASGKIDRVE